MRTGNPRTASNTLDLLAKTIRVGSTNLGQGEARFCALWIAFGVGASPKLTAAREAQTRVAAAIRMVEIPLLG